MYGSHYHVDDIPICLQRDVRKTFIERACGFDAFDERAIVTAELDGPDGASIAELKEVVQEPDDR